MKSQIKVFERWREQHGDEAGHYYAFRGFEADLHKRGDILGLPYYDMDIQQQLALFSFVVDLLDEEAAE